MRVLKCGRAYGVCRKRQTAAHPTSSCASAAGHGCACARMGWMPCVYMIHDTTHRSNTSSVSTSGPTSVLLTMACKFQRDRERRSGPCCTSLREPQRGEASPRTCAWPLFLKYTGPRRILLVSVFRVLVILCVIHKAVPTPRHRNFRLRPSFDWNRPTQGWLRLNWAGFGQKRAPFDQC